MNKIQKFIKDNDLDFTGSGSGLNGNCVILAGFALYLNNDTDDYAQLLDDIQEGDLHTLTADATIELERVFDFAYGESYGDWWKEVEAHDEYEFE